MSTAGTEQTEFQKYLKTGIHLLQKLPEFYQKSSVQVKRDVLGSIFPEKLTIGEKKCRTTKINEAVLLITATDKGFRGNKKGQPFKNLGLSRQVEPTGVEPVSKHDI
ncbi:MAG TPA: hypothetical protein VM884_07775 [Flavisolibacter sp.]|nr:hypothetical protein [Flavisolibacter sp.]